MAMTMQLHVMTQLWQTPTIMTPMLAQRCSGCGAIHNAHNNATARALHQCGPHATPIKTTTLLHATPTTTSTSCHLGTPPTQARDMCDPLQTARLHITKLIKPDLSVQASPSGPKVCKRGKTPRDYQRSWTHGSWVQSSTGFSKPVGFVKAGSWERDDKWERWYALQV